MTNEGDEYTRECLPLKVACPVTGQDVQQVLEGFFLVRGVPAHVRSDNVPEFVAKGLRTDCNSRCHVTGGSLSPRPQPSSLSQFAWVSDLFVPHKREFKKLSRPGLLAQKTSTQQIDREDVESRTKEFEYRDGSHL